ncbi:hypothetical protein CONPUDRAFT_160656 [Coniophora puteana RWD-64-598 SS2]|uniref:DEAD/DEAH box helicase domain-containing protein n=1 Tax=Coniophora puteana (strain RWD-64-598) TaxID=741705 RepID=R7SCD8_CONPW|nr:uncharacterized protein CONPUDRAFT_160656 [Coniophora puteana RWD-64-598 SS2]EIW73836.1 hypothetical protein CONPUDRAFT_160656 [Coniophora puteana RWD-64-598 SS2]
MSNYAIISSIPSWISEKPKDDVKRIISCKSSDWCNGPREYQVASWARTLTGISQVVVGPTGGGKTALLVAVVPLLEALKSERLDGAGVVPEWPVALILPTGHHSNIAPPFPGIKAARAMLHGSAVGSS